MTREQGFFITLEGVDGCGKTSMAGRLAVYLRQTGLSVLLTREPGGSALGAELRRAVLHGNEILDPRTETLLFAADRAQHMASLILPALERGEVVICDRFTDSTLAYQGGGRGLDAAELEQINSFASFGLRPDITLYLRAPLKVAFSRREGQADRLEREEQAFFERVAAFYDGLALADPARIVTVDASPGPDEVWEQIVSALKRCLPARFLPGGGP